MIAGGHRGEGVRKAKAIISSRGATDTTRATYTGRIIAGLVAGGEDPDDFAGTDFVDILESQYDDATGAWETGKDFFGNLEAANGWLAAGGDLDAAAVGFIEDNACSNGGFGFDSDCSRGSDVDTTAMVINVLVEAGGSDSATVRSAREWLVGAQRADGGFGFRPTIDTSADSTGLALAAIAALDEDPKSGVWAQRDGDHPVKALMRLQHDSGGFRTTARSKSPNPVSTKNAIPGLAGLSYPVREGLPPKAVPTATPEKTQAPRETAEPDREDDDDADDDPPQDTPVPRVGGRAGPGRGGLASSARGTTTAPTGAPRADRIEATPPAASARADSFRAPVEAEAARSSGPLRSVVLWGGVVLAAAGAGVGVHRRRRRA